MKLKKLLLIASAIPVGLALAMLGGFLLVTIARMFGAGVGALLVGVFLVGLVVGLLIGMAGKAKLRREIVLLDEVVAELDAELGP